MDGIATAQAAAGGRRPVPALIEPGIGLTLVYPAGALVVTAATEAVAGVLRTRAAMSPTRRTWSRMRHREHGAERRGAARPSVDGPRGGRSDA